MPFPISLVDKVNNTVVGDKKYDTVEFIKSIFKDGCPAAVIHYDEFSFIIRNKSNFFNDAGPYIVIKIIPHDSYFYGVDRNKFNKIVNKLRKSKRIVDATQWLN